MKILLLNPQIDAQHKVFKELQAAGHTVLGSASADEAWKLIQAHGTTLELAVIHRELAKTNDDDAGEKFIEKLKADPKHTDLPMILTSSVWSEAQFFTHQQSKAGVNAYIHWPFDEKQISQMIQSMFGSNPKAAESAAKPVSDTDLTANTGLMVVLENTNTGLTAPPKEPNAGGAKKEDSTSFNIVFDPPDPTATGTAATAASVAPASLLPQGGAAEPKLTSSAGDLNLGEASQIIELARSNVDIQKPAPGGPLTPDSTGSVILAAPEFDQKPEQTASTIALPSNPAVVEGTSSSIALSNYEENSSGVIEPRLAADYSKATPGVPVPGTGSLTLGALANADLEPHERLEIMRKIQSKAAASGKDNNTMVLDTGELGLKEKSTPRVNVEIKGDAEPEIPAIDATMVKPMLRQKSPIPTLKSSPLADETEATAEKIAESQMNDADVPGELSYLFERKQPLRESPGISFVEPVGDAVIPGGVSQTPDVETLKKYLMLREQDVAVLSNQLKSAKEQIAHLDKMVKAEVSKSDHLGQVRDNQNRRIEEFEKEKALALNGLQTEIDELKFQYKTKSDKAKSLETQVLAAADEIDRLKGRVRTDIRKIRVREKELENKLEIVKRDSEALISSRESRIMELKRKIDLLEFNMDLLQDQLSKEKEVSAQLRERLGRAAQVVRVAGGLLDTPGKPGSEMQAGADINAGKNTREAS